uniref:Coiled-coil domain-containing protein 93 n=1 Tax=Photinus pyralis TaxID=7054 RepID=A0A1Y1MZ71_PHOPY
MATVNPDIHQKFRNVKKPSVRQAGDGNEVEVEVREDEEQSVKLQEILDLLVAAGYFRARIKGLSPFDKIIGGMTWCIESCSIDVDVDLLFQENSTIGQKIALTEKIVAVLPKLNCPHRIEPHQIQGLDCVHIFPVVQWLVKRSMEFRQEMSAFVRSYAVSQFSKEFHLKNRNADVERQIMNNVNVVKEVYKPHRYYRRKNAPPDDLPSKVQITLLEYGLRGERSASKTDSDSFEHDPTAKDDPDQFILNEEERLELIKHYATLQSEMEDGGIKSQEEKRKAVLERQKQTIMERNAKLAEDIESLKSVVSENKLAIDNCASKQLEADKALNELSRDEKENFENLKEVEDLVILNDNLKAQEVQFREKCKQELSSLQNRIEESKKTPDEPDSKWHAELKDESDKVKALRLQLAKKNRAVVLLQRKLDDIPSRAELAQYQKRFLELYNQVAAKHKETKQYYTLYNTLEDTRNYIQREIGLLNSICDTYPEAMSSSSGKNEFLKQMEFVADWFKNSKQRIESKLDEEKSKRDQLRDTLQNLIEQQRKYVVALKQLSIECRKHEALLSHQQAF